MKRLFLMFLMVFMIYGFAAMPESPKPIFTPGANAGEFNFDTGVMKGVMRAGGASIGLVPAEYTPNNLALAKTPGLPGLLNYYRVFTTNHRHGDSMRTVPSVAEVTAPDTLKVTWAPAEDRPFVLTATYHWSAPDVLDLETVVEAKAALPEFEMFLSSYLTDRFPITQVYAKQPDGTKAFMSPEPAQGTWQMFPRDADAVKLIKDGRWTYPPSPVDWAIRPEFAAPLLYRRDAETKLAQIVMTRPKDCFAVSTPCSNEGHYSMYLSLFGKTLAVGDVVRARTRMIVAPLDDTQIVAKYDEFMRAFPEDR
ncbi:MAG TPA: hypothetical protein PLI09_07560 [Candidatus Hydrogenedentes bacterium]|nr:hypothetical protein [Candidatus Hydrogenedentota bacterium]